MGGALDIERIKGHGWRQGALLGRTLAARASELRPRHVSGGEDDALVVLSHDCDLGNPDLEKEPVVEVARAAVLAAPKCSPQLAGGRNPRRLQVDGVASAQILDFRPHERWFFPREWLAEEAPHATLPERSSRQLAKWTAKRFARRGFPDAFDARWRGAKSAQRTWLKLLAAHSDSIRGVYLRLHAYDEFPDDQPYRLSALVLLRAPGPDEAILADTRLEIEDSVTAFWSQFAAGLCFDGCDVKAADEITLAELEAYRPFEADWISEADGTDLPPEET